MPHSRASPASSLPASSTTEKTAASSLGSPTAYGDAAAPGETGRHGRESAWERIATSSYSSVCRIATSASTRARSAIFPARNIGSAAHVDGVDLHGADDDLDPGLAGLVVEPVVGAVLRVDLVGEGVVVVRADLGVAADLQVAEGDRQVKQEQAYGRVGLEVLGLLAGRVERDGHRVALGEEPHLGHLGAAVRADGGQGGEVAVEQVAVRRGNLGHGSPLVGRRQPIVRLRDQAGRAVRVRPAALSLVMSAAPIALAGVRTPARPGSRSRSRARHSALWLSITEVAA